MSLLILVFYECLVTPPSHFFFPTKYTYPFTIYKVFFEEKCYLHVEFLGEIIEGLVVLGYFISFITNYEIYFILKIISITLVCLFIIFFSIAEIMIIIYKIEFDPQNLKEPVNTGDRFSQSMINFFNLR